MILQYKYVTHPLNWYLGLTKVGTKKEIDGYEDDSDNENEANTTQGNVDDDSDDDNKTIAENIGDNSDDDGDVFNVNTKTPSKLQAVSIVSTKKSKSRVSFGTDMSLSNTNIKKKASTSSLGGDVLCSESEG
jgi:hypothetical protein